MMKNLKSFIAVGVMVLSMGAVSASAFAASAYKTPAEVAAGVTGRSVESVTAEHRQSGKRYGLIAKDAGKFEIYKAQRLELKKSRLQEQVAAGRMSKERAASMLVAMEKRQADCNGREDVREAGKGRQKFAGKREGSGGRDFSERGRGQRVEAPGAGHNRR